MIEMLGTKEVIAERHFRLARGLSEKGERFPFPGVNHESYSALKETEAQFPEYTAPVDELIGRFEAQGMKVVLAQRDPTSGNIYVLPSQSDDIEMDGLFPRHLEAAGIIDDRIKELIMLDKVLFVVRKK